MGYVESQNLVYTTLDVYITEPLMCTITTFVVSRARCVHDLKCTVYDVCTILNAYNAVHFFNGPIN